MNNLNNLTSIKNNQELNVGDFVKIKILSKTFNYNDNQIKTMAYLMILLHKMMLKNTFQQLLPRK